MKLAKKIREEGRASSQVPEDEDEVVVTVTWIPHPLKPDAKSVSWQYKIGRVCISPDKCCEWLDKNSNYIGG